MTLIRLAGGTLATAGTMLALDAAWLMSMTPRFYKPRLGGLMAEAPSPAPAVVFYLLYVAAIVALAVLPALDGGWNRLLANAALLGLTAYGTYDLTNQATLKGWPLSVTLADMAWGVVATTAAACAGYVALLRLNA
jgi:uncharacterized membrane protein